MDRDAKETVPKKENKHQLIRLIASNLPSQDIKARVEEGQGVPFFDERFNCREVLKVRPSPFEVFSFSSFSSSLSLIDFNRIHFFSGETWILYDYTHVLLSAALFDQTSFCMLRSRMEVHGLHFANWPLASGD